MEESISKSRIQLSNTSSSYAQYLESLPTNYTMEYDNIAQIILKASKYLLNNNCKKCVYDKQLIKIFGWIITFNCRNSVYRVGIDDKQCAEAISTYKLPASDLLTQCEELNDAETRISSYRRLLPANYADGFSKVCFRSISFYKIDCLIHLSANSITDTCELCIEPCRCLIYHRRKISAIHFSNSRDQTWI